MKKLGIRNLDHNVVMLAIVAIVIFILMSCLNTEVFLSESNFKSMGMQISELGFFAVAMMISFLSGGLDLSVVGVANFAGMFAGFIFVWVAENNMEDQLGLYVFLAYLVGAGVGIGCGAFNGFLISHFNIPPLLVTLGSLDLFAGIAYIVTESEAIVGFPAAVSEMGNASVGPLSVPLIMLIGVIVITAIILNKTRFGAELKLVGTNPTASKFSGIKNKQTIIKTYIMCSVIAAIAGVMMVMKVNSAKVGYGESYMFTSILCVILGGVSPSGGYGKLLGVVLALVSLQLLTSMFNLLSMSAVIKDFIFGVLLLGVMVLNYFFEQKRLNRRL